MIFALSRVWSEKNKISRFGFCVSPRGGPLSGRFTDREKCASPARTIFVEKIVENPLKTAGNKGKKYFFVER